MIDVDLSEVIDEPYRYSPHPERMRVTCATGYEYEAEELTADEAEALAERLINAAGILHERVRCATANGDRMTNHTRAAVHRPHLPYAWRKYLATITLRRVWGVCGPEPTFQSAMRDKFLDVIEDDLYRPSMLMGASQTDIRVYSEIVAGQHPFGYYGDVEDEPRSKFYIHPW